MKFNEPWQGTWQQRYVFVCYNMAHCSLVTQDKVWYTCWLLFGELCQRLPVVLVTASDTEKTGKVSTFEAQLLQHQRVMFLICSQQDLSYNHR